MQAGVDAWRDDRDRIGVFGVRGEVDVDVTGLVTDAAATRYIEARTGRVALRGTGAGATWTHVGAADWYVDTVLEAMRFDGRASTEFASLALRGDATIVSVEAGRAFAIGPHLVLEPQAHLAWQGTSFEERNDGLGRIALNATRGTSVRIGARARWSFDANGRAWMPWLRMNLQHDGGALAETWYDDKDVVPLRFGGTRMDAGAGVSAQLSATASLFASVDHGFGLDAEGDRRFRTQATAGFQLAW